MAKRSGGTDPEARPDRLRRAGAPAQGRRWRVPLALFCLVACVYGATVSTNPSPDAYTADFAGWHIARTGDPVPTISDFPLLDDNIIRETWLVTTADGREAVGRSPGVIAAVVPAYWLLGGDRLSAVPGGLTAALISAGTVTLFLLLLRDRIGTRRALPAALLLAFGTPLWSVAADAVWPHTLTAFGIVGMAWAADRGRWWLVGLFGGVALWGRLHAALICAVLGVGVAWARRRPGIAVRVGVAAVGLLAAMSLWTRWMYGRWDPSSGYRAGDFTGGAAAGVLDVLNYLGFVVSADRGLLWWAPLLVVLGPALVRGWGGLPDWSRSLALAGVAYLLTQGALVRFSGGDQFYGYRTSLELVVCLAPALALCADRLGERGRRWLGPVAVLQVVLIAPGAVLDGFYVKVADVWWRNAFLDGWVRRPATMLVLVAATLLAVWLVARLLRAPRVVRLLEADAPTPA
ncbi:hypothetical protein [Nocardioides sp. YIM 152588]|uniref:hypothetical protein n=1 Tax=Nocardioides sp. YIM 152588 TaxID=3158259 RepID=UPI0032E4F8B4